MQVLYLASQNPKKLKELQRLAGKHFQPRLASDLDPNISWVESGETFDENALIKAQALRPLTDAWILADDSGLEVEALEGAPGIYSARYSGPEASDQDNIEKLLEDMKSVPEGRRQAKFVCSLVLLTQDRVYQARGECPGVILEEPAGSSGFGYDPVFYLPNHDKTMAELSSEIKNEISHRANALRNLLSQL